MGQFRLWPGTKKEIVLKNSIMQEGEQELLAMLLQGDNTLIASGGPFYLGLCGVGNPINATLATLIGEPAIVNGYARQAITRDTVGWPNITLVNGVYMAQSKIVTFTPVGGDFSIAVSCLFLCSILAGAAGKLFAVSGPLDNPFTVELGSPFPVQYEFFLRS